MKFVDTFINMKIDECDDSIKVVDEEIIGIERRLSTYENDTKAINALANEYYEILIRKHRLVCARSRLEKIYNKRTIEMMVNDPELNKE